MNGNKIIVRSIIGILLIFAIIIFGLYLSRKQLKNDLTFVETQKEVKVGSTVTYYPAGATYTWKGKYATSAVLNNEKTSDDVEMNSQVGGKDRITKWKVLFINDKTGMVEMVPASQPETMVKLQGANGYNNAVYLLNEACKSLYSNPNAEISYDNIRNINIEDIEKALKEDVVKKTKEDNYLILMKNASNNYKITGYTKNVYYPLIYAKEKNSIINGNEKKEGLEASEQSSLIERDELINELQLDGITTITQIGYNGFVNATTSIKPYHTFWTLFISLNTIKNPDYLTVICPKKNNYWIASRCIHTCVNNSYFYVHFVENNTLSSNCLFFSSYDTNNSSRSIFPVLTFPVSFLESDGRGGYRFIAQKNINE